MPLTMHEELPTGTSPLQVAVPAPADAEAAATTLGPARGEWLGERVAPERYLMRLELRVAEHLPRVAFHKAAYVDLGPAMADAAGVSLPISWRAAGLTPLFPVFAGTLSWRAGELRLDGLYAPPGGGVGQIADRLLLNVAARATGRRLLERIAAAMRGELSA